MVHVQAFKAVLPFFDEHYFVCLKCIEHAAETMAFRSCFLAYKTMTITIYTRGKFDEMQASKGKIFF